MTQIYFLIDTQMPEDAPEPLPMPMMYITQDPRTPRELLKLINTGALLIGADEVDLYGEQQWAQAYPPLHIITVVLSAPPVQISPRMYDVLYGIADGKRADQIARELGIKRRTVYEYSAALKSRFGALSLEHLVELAKENGMLCTYPDDPP